MSSWDQISPVADDDRQRWEFEMGFNIDGAFPSKYLKASDLDGRQHTLTISSVTMEDMQGDTNEKKPVVYFEGAKKGLVLNRTNARTISSSYGRDTDGWTGKPVILFQAMVDAWGETVEAIRLRIPKPVVAPKPAPESHNELNPPPSDDIPF